MRKRETTNPYVLAASGKTPPEETAGPGITSSSLRGKIDRAPVVKRPAP